MKRNWTFALPAGENAIQVHLISSRELFDQEYILLFDFDVDTAQNTTPANVNWSHSLASPFQYVPPSAPYTTITMKEFVPPNGSTRISITVRDWNASNDLPDPIERIVLQTKLSDTAAVLFSEGEL